MTFYPKHLYMSVSTYMYHDERSIREITCKKRDNCGKTKPSNLSQPRSKGDHGTAPCLGVDSGHWNKNNLSLLGLVGCFSFMNFIQYLTFIFLSKMCVKFVMHSISADFNFRFHIQRYKKYAKIILGLF